MGADVVRGSAVPHGRTCRRRDRVHVRDRGRRGGGLRRGMAGSDRDATDRRHARDAGIDSRAVRRRVARARALQRHDRARDRRDAGSGAVRSRCDARHPAARLRAGRRRRRAADRMDRAAVHPAERASAGARARHARHRDDHSRRGRAELHRPRRAAALARMGRDAGRRPKVLSARLVAQRVPRPRDHAGSAVSQHRRGRGARRLGSAPVARQPMRMRARRPARVRRESPLRDAGRGADGITPEEARVAPSDSSDSE